MRSNNEYYLRCKEIDVPFYEYKCDSCGSISEHLVGVGSDQSEVECVKCGSEALTRVMSLVSVNRGAAPEGCCGGNRENCDGNCAHAG